MNNIVIMREEYNSNEDFFNAIKEAIKVLLDNNYIMVVRYDDKGLGIVVIEYSSANQELGQPYPYWSEEEE